MFIICINLAPVDILKIYSNPDKFSYLNNNAFVLTQFGFNMELSRWAQLQSDSDVHSTKSEYFLQGKVARG